MPGHVPERVPSPRDHGIEEVEVRRVVHFGRHLDLADARVTSRGWTEKTYLRITARKKIGIEIPISDPTSDKWSKTEPYHLAARNPSGKPTPARRSWRRSRAEGRREALLDLTHHRAPRGDALSEIARGRRLQVVPVLLEDRPVESVAVPDLGDPRGGRALAEEGLRRARREGLGSTGRRGSKARGGSGREGAADGRRNAASTSSSAGRLSLQPRRPRPTRSRNGSSETGLGL